MQNSRKGEDPAVGWGVSQEDHLVVREAGIDPARAVAHKILSAKKTGL